MLASCSSFSGVRLRVSARFINSSCLGFVSSASIVSNSLTAWLGVKFPFTKASSLGLIQSPSFSPDSSYNLRGEWLVLELGTPLSILGSSRECGNEVLYLPGIKVFLEVTYYQGTIVSG